MFNQTDSYQGGIVLPETPALGHASPEAENEGGAISQSVEASEKAAVVSLPDVKEVLNTPDAFLQKARMEAQILLKETRAEADQMREEILEAARNEAEEIKASALMEVANNFGSDLWSSRHALADIVSEAIGHMIGELGEEEAAVKAVEHAIQRYCSDKQVLVRAEQSTADRLRLALLSKRNDLPVEMLKVRNDDLLEKGRCIISTEEKTFEVSVRGQIQTINNLGTDIVAASSETNCKD